MKDLKNCPLIKKYNFDINSPHIDELYSYCINEYLSCDIKNCPKNLI